MGFVFFLYEYGATLGDPLGLRRSAVKRIAGECDCDYNKTDSNKPLVLVKFGQIIADRVMFYVSSVHITPDKYCQILST